MTNTQDILQIDPSSSLLKLDLPLGNEILRSEIEVSHIEEAKLRTFLFRWRGFLEFENKLKISSSSFLSQEELEKQEKEFFTYQDFVLSLTREIFCLDSVRFLSRLVDSQARELTKQDLCFWLEGDFIFIWGKLFYYLLESSRIAIKKKSD